MTTRTRILASLVAFGLVAPFVSAVRAEDKPVSAAGTWTWTMKRPGQDEEIKQTLKLKQDGEKLTGDIEGPRGKSDISEGKIEKDGALKFQVVREVNGNTFTIKYTGKVTGDKMKLQGEMERDGETRKFPEVEAKREGEKS